MKHCYILTVSKGISSVSLPISATSPPSSHRSNEVSSDVVRKSTVGVMFDGNGLIENVLIGGPASASRKIRKGDRVICDRRKREHLLDLNSEDSEIDRLALELLVVRYWWMCGKYDSFSSALLLSRLR